MPQEVGQQVLTGLSRQHTLWVELHPEHWQRPMCKTHDGAIGAVGGDLQLWGQGFRADDEAVIAGHGNTRGEAVKQPFTAVQDRRGVTVDHLVPNDPAAKGEADALVPQTDSQYGHAPREVGDGGNETATVFGPAGTGAEYQRVRIEAVQAADIDLVRKHDDDLDAQRAKGLDEVVGERVVGVDKNEPHSASECANLASQNRIGEVGAFRGPPSRLKQRWR